MQLLIVRIHSNNERNLELFQSILQFNANVIKK
jgi:hypothetical protein